MILRLKMEDQDNKPPLGTVVAVVVCSILTDFISYAFMGASLAFGAVLVWRVLV